MGTPPDSLDVFLLAADTEDPATHTIQRLCCGFAWQHLKSTDEVRLLASVEEVTSVVQGLECRAGKLIHKSNLLILCPLH